MNEHSLFRASAGWLNAAVNALTSAGIEVLAPVEDEPGVVNLRRVTSADDATLEWANVALPLKRVFFPETEPLIHFEKGDRGDVTVESQPLPAGEIVVIGCRPCDAGALAVLDAVFQWDYDDVRYRARRERATVVSVACAQPDASCFCTSVGGSPHGTAGSDVLVFVTEDGGALLQVLTPKGDRLVERLGDTVRPAPGDATPPAAPDVQPRVDPAAVKAWLDRNFESDLWKEETLRCVGCGACTYLCPTCHCFDIVDEGTWNRGGRRRNWDSCSFAQFTVHGSGHNPRPDQAARYRQRVMHKFKYFPERFGRVACVGCGRCVRACKVGQNLLGVLARIEAEPEPEPAAAGKEA